MDAVTRGQLGSGKSCNQWGKPKKCPRVPSLPISSITSSQLLDQIAATEDFWAAEEYRTGRPLREQLDQARAHMLGIYVKDVLVSFVTFEGFPEECLIIHAFTHPDWRGQGLCVKLVDAVKALANAKSQHLFLESTKHARSFWINKCRFFRAGRRFSSRIQGYHLVYPFFPPFSTEIRDLV